MKRISTSLLVLTLALTLAGCPKDPYRAALEGSDGVANGVHSTIGTISQLYTQGVADDAYKAAAAKYLDIITDCNMTFRKSVVSVHNSGETAKSAFLPIASAFVTCTQGAVAPTGKAATALQAVQTAIQGVELAIQNAKGAN